MEKVESGWGSFKIGCSVCHWLGSFTLVSTHDTRLSYPPPPPYDPGHLADQLGTTVPPGFWHLVDVHMFV